MTMVEDWISCLRQRPADRTGEDIDIIYARLQDIKVFQRFHPMVLQQICYYSYYEDLEKGIVLFRQGDIGTNWYAILAGTLDVNVSETGNVQDAVTICTLGPGKVFGESVLDDTPRNATVITSAFCELLRVEKKDFRTIWERSEKYLEGIIQFPGTQCKPTIANEPQVEATSGTDHQKYKTNTEKKKSSSHSQMVQASRIIHSLMIMNTSPKLLKDRKYNMKTYKQCFVGSEAIEWLLKSSRLVHSRFYALGMWQALLEEETVAHVTYEHNFMDNNLLYKFVIDETPTEENVSPIPTGLRELEDRFEDVIVMLTNAGPDAMFRMALKTAPEKRSQEDLDVIFQELLHIKALSNLSTIVLKNLAAVFTLETQERKGTTLFNQGTEGNSWHIVLKGSVNVVVYGKGVVCQLSEGDDFGRLALVNDAPRTATIETCVDNCQLLKVDKENFISILRDVEVNTVRMKEDGGEVLVLKQIKTRYLFGDTPPPSSNTNYRYAVMKGTPEKMVEHLLEMRIDENDRSQNSLLLDFLLTYQLFMTSETLCLELLTNYHGNILMDSETDKGDKRRALDHRIVVKKRVAQVVLQWYKLAANLLVEDERCFLLIHDLMSALEADKLLKELNALTNAIYKKKKQNIESQLLASSSSSSSAPRRSLSFSMGFRTSNAQETSERQKKTVVTPFKRDDYVIFKVYCADHTYTTMRLKYGDTVQKILDTAEERFHFGHDCILCEVKSNSEIVPFKIEDSSVLTRLSVNGRLFIAPGEHLESLTPLPQQEGPENGTFSTLEITSSREIAYYLTECDYELFANINIYELIYHNFGRENFDKITSNLDIFLKRFNEINFWVITEMCLTNQLSKRVYLLKKFIKIATHCKEYRNWNSFYAIIMGLNNIAVSRLTQTWEKLPSKFRKMYEEFETSLDPSRNHRVYRLEIGKMKPPIVPFMAILMKDMTFIHEGNKTYFGSLVNFEKMRMITSILHLIEYCRSEPFAESPPSVKSTTDISSYLRNLRVNDNQRTLTQLSHHLEPRKT